MIKAFGITILIFSGFGIIGFAGNDDWSGNKNKSQGNESTIETTKTILVKQTISYNKKWDHYLLYPNGYYYLPPEVDYSYGKMKEIENFKVRIMPNPVSDILNIIYDMDHKGPVTIELLTSEGVLVQILLQRTEPAGHKVHSFNISGKVRPGIAYIRFKAGDMVKVEQLCIN